MTETRQEIENRLVELRRRRGALLDGKKFDSAPIAADEARLAAFSDMEGDRLRNRLPSDRRQVFDDFFDALPLAAQQRALRRLAGRG